MLIWYVYLCFQGQMRVIDVDRGCPLVVSETDESYRC